MPILASGSKQAALDVHAAEAQHTYTLLKTMDLA